MLILRAMLGLAVFILMAWAMSSNRKKFPWRVVFTGLALQIGLGLLVLKTPIGRSVFESLGDGFVHLLSFPQAASEAVFGNVSNPDGPLGFVFAFAGSGLVAIIFFSALLAVLYYLGIMQAIIWALARLMSWLMGVSGAESLAMAANVFAGQTEAPLAIRPYLSKLTMSELNALMVGGFATVAGSVLAFYMGIVGPEYAPHLLTASVMSAPAAFLIAKVMLPESSESETSGHVPFKIERNASNVLEAATIGTQEGLKLWLNVIAMLIAFIALVGLMNWPLQAIGEHVINPVFGSEDSPVFAEDKPLSLQLIFGWVLAPIAWVIGIDGWHDCQWLGTLLGIKLAVSELVVFQQLMAVDDPNLGFDHARHAAIATYAICGFANFASIGIQIGGISALVPERRADLAKLATRAMLGGAIASWMTATVAGMFIK